MSAVVAAVRLRQKLDDLPLWRPGSQGLLLSMPVSDRPAGVALLDEVCACVPGHGDAVARAEWRGRELRVHVRSPGYVGVTTDDLALARDIGNALSAGSEQVGGRQ